MKIFNFVVLLLLSMASVMAQVNVQQAPGAYTDNSLIVRDGTSNKTKDAPTLLFTTSSNPGTPNRTLKIGSNVGDSQLLIVGGSTAGNTANSFNFELHDGSDVLTQAWVNLFDLGLERWSTIYWSTLSSTYVEQSNFDPATNVTTFTNGASAPQWTSTASTGTAPFVVASTTQVTNLNAATAGTASAAPFSGLTGSTNTTAAMVVGTGASLGTSGSGTITATTAGASTNVGITDDTSTNATMYPLWVTGTSGNLPVKISSTKLSWNPFSGTFAAAVGNIGSLTSTASITGGASNMTITAGTGNSRTMALQTTTSGGVATTFLSGDATQNTTLAGNLTLGASTSSITGAAGNMTITSGTGNSRTMTLRTTTSGGTATAALTLDATQNATVGGDLTVSGGDVTLTGTSTITGGAGNMTITSGTGASRTLAFRTTTSGSTATTALTLNADQSSTFAGAIGLLSAAAPTTTAAQIAFDNNAWATSFGAVQVHNGTANTYLVGVEASDTPTNGQFPRWNTGGTITWESVTASPAGSDTQVQFNDAGALGGDAGLTYNKTTDALSIAGNLSVGTGASTAGAIVLSQGTTQSTGTTNITLQAPAAVTSHIYTLPGTVGTNGAFWTQTTSGTTATLLNTKVVPTGTVVGTTDTQTLTNKWVQARVGSTTSSATPTINTDNVDIYKLTAQAADITSFTTNLSGTPVDGDQLEIRVTGTAARAITWGAGFVAGPAALPTTTVTTKTLYVYFEYDSVVTKWVCMFSGSLP